MAVEWLSPSSVCALHGCRSEENSGSVHCRNQGARLAEYDDGARLEAVRRRRLRGPCLPFLDLRHPRHRELVAGAADGAGGPSHRALEPSRVATVRARLGAPHRRLHVVRRDPPTTAGVQAHPCESRPAPRVSSTQQLGREAGVERVVPFGAVVERDVAARECVRQAVRVSRVGQGRRVLGRGHSEAERLDGGAGSGEDHVELEL
mmetsp:Transcript_14843/g.40609  ORF Transcript_14843/g.40609 Transcript_14843/m.40609 type:complete len:205 (-) Transcript_14843:28-642(-)